MQVDVVASHSQQKRLEESPSGGHKGAGSSLEASVHKRPTVSTLNPAMAGVSGILRKEQEQWEETDKNLHDAFQDLNGLMVCTLSTCFCFHSSTLVGRTFFLVVCRQWMVALWT